MCIFWGIQAPPALTEGSLIRIKACWKNDSFTYLQMYFWGILAPPTQTVGSFIRIPLPSKLAGKNDIFIYLQMYFLTVIILR
jgi:hypothetical protein